ncbi:MAG TPA: hypothetical protein VFR81_01375 [Longimicrobium sp.]|nr:hypothetical protein [Longimicrobium sp.]
MSDRVPGWLRAAWSRLRGAPADGEAPPFIRLGAERDEIRFLGEPGGDALGILKGALAGVLDEEGNTRNAYLSRVQYAGEDEVRVALVIDGRAPAARMAPPIARACQPLVAIDLFFFDGMPAELARQVERTLTPFYVEGRAVG